METVTLNVTEIVGGRGRQIDGDRDTEWYSETNTWRQ